MTLTIDQDKMKKHSWYSKNFSKLQEVPAVYYPFKINFVHSIEILEEMTDLDISTLPARNPAFLFLNDPKEDIYSPSDGKPLDESR